MSNVEKNLVEIRIPFLKRARRWFYFRNEVDLPPKYGMFLFTEDDRHVVETILGKFKLDKNYVKFLNRAEE